MKKRMTRVGIAVLSTLACLTIGGGFAFSNGVNAVAESTADIVISDDFGQKGSLSTYENIFESSHVTKDSAGNADFALVPGTVWDAFVDADDGYITYKLEASEGNRLSTADISALVTAGHQAGVYWYNANRQGAETSVLGANFTVEVSVDNQAFTEIYNLQNATNAYEIAEEAQYNVSVAVDFSAYSYPQTAYIRMNMFHFTQEECKLTDGSFMDGKIALGKLGVFLHTTGIEGYEISESEAPNGVMFTDNFATTGLANSHAFAYENVVTDKNGNADYGLVPGKTWGAGVEAGDGYIVYKLTPSEGKYITSLKMDMLAFLSHCSLPEYINSEATDVRVDVSRDNIEWKQVYSLYGDRTVKDWDIKNHQEENTKYNISLDLTDNVGTLGDVYVRIRLLQLSFAEIPEAHQVLGNVILPGTEKVVLGCIGSRLYSVSFKTWEDNAENAPIEPEESGVYYGDVKIDYARYKDTQDYWKTHTAYETAGLTIRKDVTYRIDGEDVKCNALAPATKNSEGYITYKFVASDGKTFSSAILKSRARLFDYNLQLEWEKVDYYISYDNQNFELVKKSLITLTGSNSPEQTMDLTPYVYGRTQFFVKVVIGCSNDTSWTNMRTFEMDVEFFAPTYRVSYELNGGVNAESNLGTYYVGEGMSLADPTKEGYIFGGWFTDEEFTNRIYEISASQEGSLTLWAKWIEKTPVDIVVPEEDMPKAESGCQSSVGVALTGITALASAVFLLCKKSKKND